MTTTRRPATPDPRGRRRSPLTAVVGWATALGVGLAALAVLALTVGTMTGWLAVQTVPTGSMEPEIPEGSVIVVDPVAVADIAVGDVIVFAAPTTATMTVHRVVGIDQSPTGPLFTTKGDANEGPDPWNLSVEGDHLHEVRMVVPGVGRVLLALASPTTRLVLAGLGAALVLGFGLTHVWRRPEDTTDPSGAEATWATPLARLGPLDDADRVATTPVPLPRRVPQATSTLALVVAAIVVAGATLVAPELPSADASFVATAAAAAPVATATVPPKQAVACAWTNATTVSVSWTNPVAGDAGRLLVAATPTGAATVVATAAAGATSASYTPPAPVTTVRHLSTTAVRSTWTSTPSPLLATNTCRGSVRAAVGSGSRGSSGDGGLATAAALDEPYQPYAAPDGRIFVADSGNDRIRVVATDGTISTFAGGGAGAASPCSYAGPVSGLRLDAPRGVAVATDGTVYIADTGRGCVRRVDPGGTVSLLAGGGSTSACSATGAATSVSMSSPSGLALAPDGSLVVADTGRNCIRRVTGTTVGPVAGGGSTTTCATTVAATAVSLSGPVGVAVAPDGSVVIADTGRNCIRRVTGTTVSRIAGGGNTTSCTAVTTATAVSLSGPEGVAVAADGTVHVADTGRRCLRTVSGATVTPLGLTGANSTSGDDGPAVAATARRPSLVGLATDGDLLFADRATNNGANEVRRVELG